LIFANTTFTVQYPKRIIKNKLNRDTSDASAIITESAEPATVSDLEPMKLPSRSVAKVPCNEVQKLYNLCGTTVTRFAAIKPFRIFRQVFFIFASPDS
jgi:hypothetical protein